MLVNSYRCGFASHIKNTNVVVASAVEKCRRGRTTTTGDCRAPWESLRSDAAYVYVVHLTAQNRLYILSILENCLIE